MRPVSLEDSSMSSEEESAPAQRAKESRVTASRHGSTKSMSSSEQLAQAKTVKESTVAAFGHGIPKKHSEWPTPVQTLSPAQSRERERSMERASSARSNKTPIGVTASGQGEPMKSVFKREEPCAAPTSASESSSSQRPSPHPSALQRLEELRRLELEVSGLKEFSGVQTQRVEAVCSERDEAIAKNLVLQKLVEQQQKQLVHRIVPKSSVGENIKLKLTPASASGQVKSDEQNSNLFEQAFADCVDMLSSGAKASGQVQDASSVKDSENPAVILGQSRALLEILGQEREKILNNAKRDAEVAGMASQLIRLLQTGDENNFMATVMTTLRSRSQEMRRDIALYQQPDNGMTILHHACRHLEYSLASEFLSWEPSARRLVHGTFR